MNKAGEFISSVVALPKFARKTVVVAFDISVLGITALFAFWLRLGHLPTFLPFVTFSTLAAIAWLAVAAPTRQYRFVLRYSGAETVLGLIKVMPLMMASLAILLLTIKMSGIPRTLSVLHPILFVTAAAASRLFAARLLANALDQGPVRSERKLVLIYGAGSEGQQLAGSMRTGWLEVVGFVDPNENMRNQSLEGKPIWHTSELRTVLISEQVDEVFLAISSATRSERRRVVENLRQFAPHLPVRTLPSVFEIASGKVSISDLREVQIEELLGRDEVMPDPSLMSQNITGKCVFVTGAGGSIGSELSRQILRQRPMRLVLADQSEHALYLIDTELREIDQRESLGIEIITQLVDISDERDCSRAFKKWPADAVFHAAAYKHVPLIEANPIAGIRNNVWGTLNCCLAAEDTGVGTFILISSDKAVRPTNVMGASKRLCELIIQARSNVQRGTTYSAVRFGNVLGSSGSVVPRFRDQIARGGPVTITHLDATRYFMTIPEASQLVIQAGAMAQGGEVFLLDMGAPVKVVDLARLMIELMGLTVADETNPDGDIDLVQVGLRPGEKLIEELLIDERSEKTLHPRIIKAHELMLSWDELSPRLKRLAAHLRAAEIDCALQLLQDLVSEFRPVDEASDCVVGSTSNVRYASAHHAGKVS